MATQTALGSISNIIRQELAYVKKEVEPEIDGIFSKMYTTSAGVSQGLGRDFKVIHTFATGVAGSFKNVTAAGPATLDTAHTSGTGQTMQWNITPRVFPGLADTTSPGFVQKTITLVEGMGSFNLPFHYFQADKIDGSIADSVGIVIRGVAKNVAQVEANSFYTNNNDTKAIITVINTTGLDNNTTNDITFNVDDGTNIEGRIGRILPGMTIDAIDDDGDAVLTNSGGGVVSQVDYVGKSFIVHFSGGNVTFANNDYLIAAGTEATLGGTDAVVGPSGIETWLLDSGSPFGISLTNHPQFKSIVAAVNAVLDESTLNKYVGGFYDAYGGMYSLDAVITTTGVMTAYMEAIDGLYRYARNNERLTLHEGWSSMDYAWQGQVFQIMASRYQKPGQAYICKTNDNNIKRFVPPTVSATRTSSGFNGEIQFVAPWMGSSSIFLPTRNSSALLTEFSEAPFVCYREWCPDQLPGIKLTGLSELNP